MAIKTPGILTQVIPQGDFKPSQIAMVTMGLRRLMMIIKSKIRSLKMRRPYDKIEKSESMRVEIRSRKARKLIDEILRIADSPNTETYAF
ncbi:unnamed protein product [Dovyalis caffra]|uniref:Uncharacterized protein n=1 Tax=Dovyalis caffra TaxID=77055 RepID=A0AAV1RHL6_9ROSI|nr:unnamed protein product [Dovyalis caffra]